MTDPNLQAEVTRLYARIAKMQAKLDGMLSAARIVIAHRKEYEPDAVEFAETLLVLLEAE